ncbi:MAG: phosphoribosylglycinamide formyltransferase [Phycisphaerales bacterium]|nr:phosphoribosylglycinamide formyltransferase [Phycisphaerales bacterium]
MNQPLKLVVLISGGGRTTVNLQERILAGRLPARIERVISSRSDARGVELAKQLGLSVVVVERASHDDEAFQQLLTEAVRSVPADLICMAGFLSLWRIPEDCLGRVINIHPALLPDFGGKGMYGHRVHEAVLAAGRVESGCTVHFCDNEYDHGQIILQRKVAIPPGCSATELAAKVFAEELEAYPEAIRLIAEGCVRWREASRTAPTG